MVSETRTKLTTYSLAGTKAIDDLTDWAAKEIEEQKELKRIEKEEKRRLLLESIEVKKKLKEEENLRQQKEREYEQAQYALFLKELIKQNNS